MNVIVYWNRILQETFNNIKFYDFNFRLSPELLMVIPSHDIKCKKKEKKFNACLFIFCHFLWRFWAIGQSVNFFRDFRGPLNDCKTKGDIKLSISSMGPMAQNSPRNSKNKRAAIMYYLNGTISDHCFSSFLAHN